MPIINRLISSGIVLLGVLCVSFAQGTESTPRLGSEIPYVAYCDLIHGPKKYGGKLVRTNVTYRYGFEWAEFYCLDCSEGEGRTWVSFEEELCKKSKKIKSNGFAGRTVNMQVVGTFVGPGAYGHMGAYQFKFVVRCIEKAETIWNESYVPSKLPVEVAKRTHCQKAVRK
jgi:hypothetical protein